MKSIILVGAFALLAACGSTARDGSAGAGADNTSASAATTVSAGSTETSVADPSATIMVDNLGDMPPKCIELKLRSIRCRRRVS